MERSGAIQAHRSTRAGGSQGRRRRLHACLIVSACLFATLLPAIPAAASLISQDQEIQIGRQAAAQLEAQAGVVADPALTARLASVGGRVAAASDRPGLPYSFKILRSREVNAVSLPGGFIYATQGLMQFVESDAELAFVMGHEVGHVAARHHVAMIERQFYMSLVAQVLLGRNASALPIGDIVQVLLTQGYSRENEFEADRLGVTYAHRAGFDASAGLRFMERLRATEGRDPSQVEVLLRTHPALGERLKRVRQQLRSLGYHVARSPADAPAAQNTAAMAAAFVRP
jgi:predicted Zn-dependent protease